jgi:hypothetical protein
MCLLSGCGSGLPSSSSLTATITSSSLTATITPPTASVVSGTNAAFTGNGTGFAPAPLPQWQMVESTSVANQNCGFLLGSTQNANFSNCPMGYVVYDPNKFPNPATYYAPPTTGVYHLQFSAIEFSTFDHVTKTTTAAVTVTP